MIDQDSIGYYRDLLGFNKQTPEVYQKVSMDFLKHFGKHVPYSDEEFDWYNQRITAVALKVLMKQMPELYDATPEELDLITGDNHDKS